MKSHSSKERTKKSVKANEWKRRIGTHCKTLSHRNNGQKGEKESWMDGSHAGSLGARMDTNW